MSEKTNNTFKECCDLYMKERITNSFAETIKHTWDYRQKEIDQLKAQIERMKCRENCGNDFEINNNTSCPLYDFQNVRCPCDKWEMMKCI